MKTVTSAHSPAVWESGQPHTNYYTQKLSYTPLAFQHRTPAAAGQSLPKQSPSFTSSNSHPQPHASSDRAHGDARAASPNYFGLAVDPPAQRGSDYDRTKTNPGDSYERRANGSISLSGGILSGAAQQTQVTPVDQRPEFAAFKKQSDSSINLHLGWLPPFSGDRAISERSGSTSRPTTPVDRTVSRSESNHNIDQSKRSTPESDRTVRSPKRILSDETAAYERPRRNSPAGFVDGEKREDAEATDSLLQIDKQTQSSAFSASASTTNKVANDATQNAKGNGPVIANPSMVDPQLVADLIRSEAESVLLIDTRLSTQYVQARIAGALSLCIPTTLLKRPSFDTKKVAEIFKDEKQKQHFEDWRNSKYIIVYDAQSSQLKDASTCVQTLKKFSNEGWKGNSFVLRGGFKNFASIFPGHVVKGASTATASTGSSLKGPLTLASSSSCPSVAPAVGGCAMPATKNAANPFFGNIRQNIDLIGGVGQLKANFPSSLTREMEARLPDWLKEVTAAKDEGHGLSKKFLEIEKREQRRMQQALSGEVAYGTPKDHGGSSKAVQIAGIEKGSKNRYNNIWPYEHSRVKLEGKPLDGCDYVNANYVQSAISEKKYIATQCPVPDTFADFWSMIWHEDVRTIVMLTAEREGGHVKAHNYWKSEQYGQVNVALLSETRLGGDLQASFQDCNASSGKVKGSEHTGPSTSRPCSSSSSSASSTAPSSSDSPSETDDPDAPIVIIRKFTISKTDEPFARMREITQLQYTNWPDFGALAKPVHLLDMVEQVNAAANDDVVAHHDKSKNKLKPSYSNSLVDQSSNGGGEIYVRPLVVHCSAGCGRTGTFCTVDTVVDALKQQRQLMKKQKRYREKNQSSDETQGRKSNLVSERELTPMEIDQGSGPSMSDKLSDSKMLDGKDEKGNKDVERRDLLQRQDIDLVEKTVEEFRNQRLSMVQCLRQYVFCYEAVLEWFVRHIDD